MVHFFNPSSKIRSKQKTVCLWLQKKNQLKDLIECEILQLLSGVIFFVFILTIHDLLDVATNSYYLSWEATCCFGTSPCRFYLSWNSKRMYLACEAHDVHLQSSTLISIGYNTKHILGVNQGFFLFFWFIFLISSHWQKKLWKNHKLIQIHTRKSKVWNYIIFLRGKKTGADPLLFPCIQQICRVFHRKVKQHSL